MRPRFQSSVQLLLRHFGALDVISEVVSISHNPLFDRFLVGPVLRDKFELNNVG
jgi:hypothetical protein